MTLLPSSDFGIRGEPGKQYLVGERCAAPGCPLRSVHGHHLWSRSYLRGQPYEWVRLPDGTVIGNRVGLCVLHHDQVTGEIGGYRARIVFDQGVFWWERRTIDDRWERDPIPLTWQPPGVVLRGPPAPLQDSQPPEAELCPTCGKSTHTRPHKPSAPRKTKEWTLTVPDDAEVGSEILDDWADDISVILGFGDESSRLRRYHAVAVALAWAVQHRAEFVGDLQEAASA